MSSYFSRYQMRRRFCIQDVLAGSCSGGIFRHAFLLGRTNVRLSCSNGHAKRGNGHLRANIDDNDFCERAVGSENSGELSSEVRMTMDESQLMTAHMPEAIMGGKSYVQNEWTEPVLEDLDRSIPQVDCAFIADLIRSRNERRKEFLQKKARLKAKVESLSRQQACSVMEVSQLPTFGVPKLGSSSCTDALNPLNTGEDDSPVLTSPAVLAQLTDDERDALFTSRPEYDDGFVLLDCRTVNEVTSWGMIEGAKVLPAHEMFDSFHLTPEEFEVEVGFAKPRPEQKIICYCQYGPRSLMAAQILSWMGYINVLHFRDGYYEWGKQYNLLLRRWMLHDKESGNEVKRQIAFQAGLELQREVASEFNELPMREAADYKIETTRSRGKIIVGDGVREEAYTEVEKLVSGMEPPLLPGVLDETNRAASGSRAIGRREEHMQRFLQETTGMDACREDTRPPMGVAEMQEKVIDAFTRRDGGSHASQR